MNPAHVSLQKKMRLKRTLGLAASAPQHPDLTLLKEFVTHAPTYTKDIDKQKVKLWCSKSRGFWESYDEVYVQTLEKVYIDDTVKSMIINLIDSFISSRTKYITHGRSHKLNFLFTGVAGSGKTSLVKALALHYKRPIYSRPITDFFAPI
jgi:hypothetical protein